MATFEAVLMGNEIFSNAARAVELYEKSRFGEKEKGNSKVVYMHEEALYLVKKGNMNVVNSSYNTMTEHELTKKLLRLDKRFLTRFNVYRDLRDKGYIVKSALKFGGDFRVYEKGKKVGASHAKWVCFSASEKDNLSAQDFAAKNRVAHATKKNGLLAIVDSENDVSYYEMSWKKVV